MIPLWYSLALFFELLSTGGFIVYLVKQHKWVFQWSYWILFAGFICHTSMFAFQYHAFGALPILNLRSALAFFSWCIIGVYLVLQAKFKLMVLGSFVAPFAAFLMTISSAMPWIEGPIRPEYKSLWLTGHIGAAFIGNGLFTVAFLTAIMYLILDHSIKHKRFGSLYRRLPSLATLDAIHYHSLVYGFTLLTIGMLIGSIYARLVMGSYWQWDPKEVWSLITWFFYATLLHERIAVGWRGRKVAVMSIVCFCILVFAFAGVSLLMGGYHSFDSLGAK